jgi:hypothetical protein
MGLSCSGGTCRAVCGDGLCALGMEDCGVCLADCPCPSGHVCFMRGCCVPSCAGAPCSSDGCGGTCGGCPMGEACSGGSCQPVCGDGYCFPGLEDCGTCGSDCTCPGGMVCFNRACCAPNCAGRMCGSDGCGGSCGSCPAGQACDTTGTCGCGSLTCGATCCGTTACGCSCSNPDLCCYGTACTRIPDCGC